MSNIGQTVIEKTLCEHIHEDSTKFVFPTQTAASQWADRIITISDVKAVAMERFIAWDDFKSTSIRSRCQTKSSIPSALRDFFADRIIHQNAEEHFFKYIIAPSFADKATGFCSWISDLLPMLSLWKKYFDSQKSQPDDEDKDLLTLYQKYSQFLDSHNLFDPAWESPPFKDDGNRYIVFFPEILSDYLEYKEILSSSEAISLVSVPASSQKYPVYGYDNARAEVRGLALYIQKKHNEDKIPYNEIAVNVPNLDLYAPYLEREFSIYQIPFVKRNGSSYSATRAGSFFAAAQTCVGTNFSYDSLKTLLLNNALPWKDSELIQSLILFGKENNCICTYEDKDGVHDTWEESFSKPKKNEADERVKNFYRALKKRLCAMVNAKTFFDVRQKYFEFREQFFDMAEFEKSNSLIISRCIAELGTLIDLEKSFSDCTPSSPYSFFTDYLSQKMYVPQDKSAGVQIVPYRLCASAPFACHIIIDASQSAISLAFKQLNFLNEDKRKKLGLQEEHDVSSLFVRLYELNAYDEVYFSFAQKTFDGYALEHSALQKVPPLNLDANDFYKSEKSFLTQKKELPHAITQTQSQSLANWIKTQKTPSQKKDSTLDSVLEAVKQRATKDGLLRISYSSLKTFLDCPRKWLFQNGLGISEEDNEASLTDSFAYGNLYHLILHKYLLKLKTNSMPLSAPDGNLLPGYMEFFTQSVSEALNAPCSEFEISYIARKTLLAEQNAISDLMLKAVIQLSKDFEGCTVCETEQKHSVTDKEEPYFFTGTVDCLLKEAGSGEFILVDFKKSKTGIPKKKNFFVSEEADDVDFQMPAYVYMLANEDEPKQIAKCAFFNITEAKTEFRTGSTEGCATDGEIQQMQDTVNFMKEKAKEFSDAVKALKFNAASEEDIWTVCPKCTYRAVCRKTFTVSGE